jgi:hypothetical protein
MIIAALAGVAVLVAVLTWRYWLLTRPGLALEGDDADDARRGGGGLGYGAAPSAGRAGGPGGRRGPNPARDEPRDPRRAFVGPPGGVDPGAPPGPSAPSPGQGVDPRPTGARRRPVGPGGPRGPGGPGGPGGPAGPGGPGGPGVQGGRRTTSTPPPGRGGGPPGSAGGQGPRRRGPGTGPTPGAGGPPMARQQPLVGGRAMRDTDIWAPDRRR